MKEFEIEKKYLVSDEIKNSKLNFEIYRITQTYHGETKMRLRKMTNLTTTNEVSFFKTIKTYISPGVNIEDEETLISEEYNDLLNGSEILSSVEKIRRVVNYGDLKLEFDEYLFLGYDLNILEIEFPSQYDFEKFTIEQLPEEIRNLIIEDVTGNQEYSNFNLGLIKK